MKTDNIKLKKNTAFVYKNLKGQSNFTTDPTAETVVATYSSFDIFKK